MDSLYLYKTVCEYEQGLLPWCIPVEDAYSALVVAAENNYSCPVGVPQEWWDLEMFAFRGKDDKQSIGH
jgi:hypothetical protein